VRLARANLGQANCGSDPCSFWDNLVTYAPFGALGLPSQPCLTYLQCSDPVVYVGLTQGVAAAAGTAVGEAVGSVTSGVVTGAAAGFASQVNVTTIVILAVVAVVGAAILVKG